MKDLLVYSVKSSDPFRSISLFFFCLSQYLEWWQRNDCWCVYNYFNFIFLVVVLTSSSGPVLCRMPFHTVSLVKQLAWEIPRVVLHLGISNTWIIRCNSAVNFHDSQVAKQFTQQCDLWFQAAFLDSFFFSFAAATINFAALEIMSFLQHFSLIMEPKHLNCLTNLSSRTLTFNLLECLFSLFVMTFFLRH